MEKHTFSGINSLALHIIAMIFMLCDHLWATVIPDNMWLTCIGRIAFPIFAFMLVEGFYHTHDRRKYMLRLLVFALISEIPFNLMYGGSIMYPFHQNVIWTFLVAFVFLLALEKIRKKEKVWLTVAGTIIIMFAGWLIGTLLMVDYFGAGVLTVIILYLFRGRKWWQLVGQVLGLYFVNCVLLGGLAIPINIFNRVIEIPQQGFALLSLLFIWLYNGERGPYNKAIQMACYAFYPIHILILGLLSL